MKKLALTLVLLAVPCLGDDGIRIVSWPNPSTAASSATVTTVSVSNAGSMTLAVSRPGRLRLILFNEKEMLYIKAGTGASITDYTWRIPGSTQLDVTAYNGPITAVLGVVGPTTVHVSDF